MYLVFNNCAIGVTEFPFLSLFLLQLSNLSVCDVAAKYISVPGLLLMINSTQRHKIQEDMLSTSSSDTGAQPGCCLLAPVEVLRLCEDGAERVDSHHDAVGALLLQLAADAGDGSSSAGTQHHHVHLGEEGEAGEQGREDWAGGTGGRTGWEDRMG